MKIGSSIILCNGVHIDAYSSLPHIYSISCRYKKNQERPSSEKVYKYELYDTYTREIIYAKSFRVFRISQRVNNRAILLIKEKS